MTASPAAAGHPVVGCWKDEESATAVRLAAAVARVLGAPLALACAYEYEALAVSARMRPSAAADARFGAAAAGIGRAHALVGDAVEVHEHLVPALGVAAAVRDVAREVGACLLVVGRDTTGHVARAMVERAPCPVAVVPPGAAVAEPGRPWRIGVAYDGSPGARRALIAGRHLARATGGGLVLLSVDGAAAHAWQEDVAPGAAIEVAVAAQVLSGDPVRRLLEVGAELDLLLCGARGRGRVRAAAFGSVSARLAAGAPCTVLVVHADARRASGPLGLSCAGR